MITLIISMVYKTWTQSIYYFEKDTDKRTQQNKTQQKRKKKTTTSECNHINKYSNEQSITAFYEHLMTHTIALHPYIPWKHILYISFKAVVCSDTALTPHPFHSLTPQNEMQNVF